MGSPDHPEIVRTQTLSLLLDELLDAEDDQLALVAQPGALVGWRGERLGEFCRRVGECVPRKAPWPIGAKQVGW